VSDGLAQDLGHVCRASDVAAELDAATIPVAAACRRALGTAALRVAATGGEDYELVVTASPARRRRLERLVPRLGCTLTRIGRIVAGRPAVRLLDAQGRPLRLGRAGFDHFR
jgi:thiamine-monophosphate kinase